MHDAFRRDVWMHAHSYMHGMLERCRWSRHRRPQDIDPSTCHVDLRSCLITFLDETCDDTTCCIMLIERVCQFLTCGFELRKDVVHDQPCISTSYDMQMKESTRTGHVVHGRTSNRAQHRQHPVAYVMYKTQQCPDPSSHDGARCMPRIHTCMIHHACIRTSLPAF